MRRLKKQYTEEYNAFAAETKAKGYRKLLVGPKAWMAQKYLQDQQIDPHSLLLMSAIEDLRKKDPEFCLIVVQGLYSLSDQNSASRQRYIKKVHQPKEAG